MKATVTKPDKCKLCPQYYLGTGFCPDYSSSNPKLMFLLETPYSDDVILQKPLSGSMGDFLESKLLNPVKLKREDLLICNVLRCKSKDYPTGKIKKQAENACRIWDADVRKFDPKLFVITFGIDDTFNDPAFLALMIEDIKRAKWVSEHYKEPTCLLMGKNAVNMVTGLPFEENSGGLRSWRGHYFRSRWNY